MSKTMRLGVAQLQPAEDMHESAAMAFAAMERAAGEGADAICFPELQLSPFFPQFPSGRADRFRVSISHELVCAFQAKSRELHLAAFPNVYLAEGSKAYDATIAIDSEGAIVGVSKMVHIVQAPRFHEKDYYAPSETGFQVYEFSFARIGVVICYDRHFPESIRSCVLAGADVILVPTADVRGESLELFEWEMRVSAAQNGIFIATCNRVGKEHDLCFAGGSVVIDPSGDVVARAGSEAQVLCTELDLAAIPAARKQRPYVALRRPEVYRLDGRAHLNAHEVGEAAHRLGIRETSGFDTNELA